MTPVDQKIFDFKRGDCFRACVASIFDLALEDVPNFMADGPDRFDFLVDEFFDPLGLICLDVNAIDTTDGQMSQMYVIATGQSPRGTERKHQHSVVWRRGKMVHDPHPERAGLIGDPETYTLFVVKDPASYYPLAVEQLDDILESDKK